MSRISIPFDVFGILVTRWNLEDVKQEEYYKVENWLRENRINADE